jgi:hypothetical protein
MVFIALFGYFFTGISCCFSGAVDVQKAESPLTKLDGEPVNVEEPVVNETVVEDEAAEIGGRTKSLRLM